MENIYQTKDFYLSALLMAHGFELVGSSKKEKSVFFHLKITDKDKLDNLVKDFVNYEAMVNLGKLTRCLTILRRELDKHKK